MSSEIPKTRMRSSGMRITFCMCVAFATTILAFAIAQSQASSSVPAHVLIAYSHNTGIKDEVKGFETIAAAALPAEARITLKLIKQGGPFPYPKDGTIFGNRERRLPAHPRRYYKEYTVKTPGGHGRGARRIIAGSSGEFYYTDNHYNSFKLIKE
jgi:ribonuclease T1